MSKFIGVHYFAANIALFRKATTRFLVFTLSIFLAKSTGGRTEFSNLALACPECNRKKGTIIGSRKHSEGEFIRLFNPRTDAWSEHFEFNWAIIHPKTDVGEITSKMLGFSDDFRITFREYLMLLGAYP